MRTSLVALVGVLIGMFAVPSSAAANASYGVYLAEAETFSRSSASLVTDWKASGNRAAVLNNGGAIWRWSTMPAGNRFVIRAKANTCGTAPRMVFKIGTTVVRNVGVSRSDWTDYPVQIDQPAGTHVLSVWFLKDGVKTSGCTRLLRVDSIYLRSANPVNQGVPGSTCQPSDSGIAYRTLPAGYSTNAMGAGPGYYETAPPSDRSASASPEGLMMLIHGGGWYVSGAGAAQAMRPTAELWRSEGWSVLSVTSSKACGSWLQDVLWFYDRARATWPDLAICVNGHSAGGHLALLVAAHRPDARCAISYGGPTDLVGLSEQEAYGGQTIAPTWIKELAIAAFGVEGLEAHSPLHLAEQIGSPVLVAVAERDALIPSPQATAMFAALEQAHPDVRHESMILETGTTGWVHAKVSQAAADTAWTLGLEIAGPQT